MINFFRVKFFLTFWLVYLLCNSQLHAEFGSHLSTSVNKAEKVVAALPEVVKADKQCQRLSKGKRHLVTFVSGDPTPDDNYFQVKVAEDNGTAFHAWFIFEVEPKTYRIYYNDTSTGFYIPLNEWRKNPKKYK